ncbi:MAG: LysM peptidoglycan-binding domain-containing protein [Gammaproteobacteria bacterium]
MTTTQTTITALAILLLSGCASIDTSTRLHGSQNTARPADSGIGAAPVEARPLYGQTASARVDGPFWQQLRREFRLPDKQYPAVRRRAAQYAGKPQQVERIFTRGAPYLGYIGKEVRKRKFPGEVALLPFIESGYNPFAVSHGQAAGLWQFIPSTGKHFDLQQDWWHDRRRDVIASTAAALDYLGQLHQEFDGDWLLAFAAYNAGGGTIRDAIKRNRLSGKPVDFWHLELPEETRGYVPKLLAISTVVQQPAKYGVQLPPVSNDPVFVRIDTNRQLDIAVAADLAGIETAHLYQLNPGFNRWATSPAGPHYLAIPVEKSESFRQNLSALPVSAGVKWERHRINPGETLTDIAQRYNTTIEVLRVTNDLHGNTIRAGSYLTIPAAVKDPSRYAVLAKRLQPSRAVKRKLTHEVRNGDSLWAIARRYQVTVDQVALWNKLNGKALIKPGQELVIWKGAKPAEPVTYTVRKGDSLYRISRKFNVSVLQLRKWNDLPEGRYLQPGQNLKLYVDAGRPGASRPG